MVGEIEEKRYCDGGTRGTAQGEGNERERKMEGRYVPRRDDYRRNRVRRRPCNRKTGKGVRKRERKERIP